MTKKDAWLRFYEYLTPEEKEDHNNLPNFVKHIAYKQPQLSKECISWAKSVCERLTT